MVVGGGGGEVCYGLCGKCDEANAPSLKIRQIYYALIWLA